MSRSSFRNTEGALPACLAVAMITSLALAAEPAVQLADQIGLGNRDGAIPLEPGKATVVKKVGVEDCRAVRAFIHYPIDGRLDTRHYHNRIREYPNTSGDGANYEYNHNDGVHIRLADDKGFDAVLVRGGYKGTMYRDSNALDGPGTTGVRVCEVASRNNVFRALLPERVKTAKVDFYQPKREGLLADVSFFRVGAGNVAPWSGPKVTYGVGERAEAPEKIQGWLSFRFGPGQRVIRVAEGQSGKLVLQSGRFLHVLTPVQKEVAGIVGVGIRFTLARAEPGQLLTIRVQDSLNPRRELMGADFNVPGPGAYEVILDTPDQLMLPTPEQDKRPILEGALAPPFLFWISLAADAPTELGGVQVDLYRSSREAAFPEAIALRKLLLKGYFYMMSEPRPWMRLRRDTNVREWLAKVSSGRYAPGLEQLFETLEQCRLLDPKDDIIRQYYEWIYQRKKPRGEWPIEVVEAPGAPRWAVLAREGFVASSRIPGWWMENRKVPTGELGGWVGDDSDMYQTWASFPLIESAPLGEMLLDGAQRLSELALATHLEKGLNKRTTDPLHAYEEGTNHLALCAWWFYGDPVHVERAMEAARSVEKLTVVVDGRRHFHGQRLGAADLKKMGPIDRDGGSCPLFMHPVYEVAWYNRNPAAVKFYGEWADTWIAFQKPGQWATAVDVKTGKVTSTSSRPGRGGYESQGDAWFGAYQATGDARFLKPYFLAFDANVWGFKHYHQVPNWMTAPAFGEKMAEFKKHYAGPGYAGFLLTGNKKLLEPDLERTIREYQRFPYIYTAAEQFTDRVFTTAFAPVAEVYTGSYTTRNQWVHYHAVSYEGLKGRDFAALVSLVKPDALRVSLYNFTDRTLEGRLRVWRLDHGRYKVRVGPDANDDSRLDSTDRETTEELYRYAPVAVKLPPKRLTMVEITQVEKLDDILERPDLALSPLDTKRQAGGSLEARVHNIGAKAAANVEVALVRDGKTVAAERITALQAPLDLVPRIATVTFKDARAGDQVVVDPANAIPEIAEHNNRVRLE